MSEFIAVNYPKLHEIHDGWFLAFRYNPNRNMDVFQGTFLFYHNKDRAVSKKQSSLMPIKSQF